MKINAINNQNFEARKFRLPIKTVDLTNPELMALGKQEVEVNWYKVFENPKAGVLYKQAQRTQDWQDKARLFAEMGHYEIVEYGTGLIGWFRKLFDIRKRVNNDLFRQ